MSLNNYWWLTGEEILSRPPQGNGPNHIGGQPGKGRGGGNWSGQGWGKGGKKDALAAPENTVAPTISGDTDVGSTLTVDEGTWTGNPAPTFTHQWTRDSVDIPGATSSTYTTTDDDFGAAIRCDVTGTNSEGSDTATSSNSITVTDADVLLNATFESDDEGFTSGTRVADEGYDFEDGYLSWPADTTQAVSLSSAPTTGVHRFDFSVFVPDTTTGAIGSVGSFIYALPTAGSVNSANSLGAIVIDRTSSGQVTVRYRTGGAWSALIAVARKGWLKVSLVLDLDNSTYDVYLGDLLMQRGIAFENGSAADFGRVGLASIASTPTTHFDALRVTKDWTLPAESVLVTQDFTAGSGEIEDSKPDTDGVNVNKQNWVIPIASGDGGFTLGANGAEPDAGVSCSAFYRVGSGEGEFEATFTASAADGIYGGVIARSWNGNDDGDGMVVFRYWSGSANVLLLQSDTANLATSGSLSGTTITAGNDYTVKIVARGRYYWCYINDVLQFGGPVQQGTTNSRGIMQEHHAGPIVHAGLSGVGTDNYVKDFTFTGRLLTYRRSKTIGDWQMVTEGGRVVELYSSGLAVATDNLMASGGIQYGHMPEHDISPYRPEVRTVYDTDNLLVLQQRGPCLSEGDGQAHADCHVVFRRAGFWVSDRLFAGSGGDDAPDVDLREHLWSRDIRHIANTGASTAVTKSLGLTDYGSSALPAGYQALTDPASGDTIRLTQIVRNNENLGGSSNARLDRLDGFGGPYTLQVSCPVTGGNWNEAGRYVYLERGSLSLSATVIEGLRDDLASPMTPTVSVGSLKTDAGGDLDTDGFNERFGWAEVTCDGSGHATFTIDGATTARYHPAVRLNGYTSGGTIAGLTEGTDYLLDDLGDGNALVQILSVVSASTQYAYST